ncbi:MAG: class I lanthipeptide [Flavobacterium sp.]
MKKIKLTKGLQINKDAVSKLQETQMKDVKGGQAAFSCWSDSCNSKVAQQTEK